jgi:hypothetical protein
MIHAAHTEETRRFGHQSDFWLTYFLAFDDNGRFCYGSEREIGLGWGAQEAWRSIRYNRFCTCLGNQKCERSDVYENFSSCTKRKTQV